MYLISKDLNSRPETLFYLFTSTCPHFNSFFLFTLWYSWEDRSWSVLWMFRSHQGKAVVVQFITAQDRQVPQALPPCPCPHSSCLGLFPALADIVVSELRRLWSQAHPCSNSNSVPSLAVWTGTDHFSPGSVKRDDASLIREYSSLIVKIKWDNAHKVPST